MSMPTGRVRYDSELAGDQYAWTVDPTVDSRPPYLAVAEHLRRRIAAGEFQPGDQLPSGKELARTYQVAPNTVLNAIRALRDAGLVSSQQGRGTFVRDTSPADVDLYGESTGYQALHARLADIQQALRDLDDRVGALERDLHGQKDRQEP